MKSQISIPPVPGCLGSFMMSRSVEHVMVLVRIVHSFMVQICRDVKPERIVELLNQPLRTIHFLNTSQIQIVNAWARATDRSSAGAIAEAKCGVGT